MVLSEFYFLCQSEIQDDHLSALLNIRPYGNMNKRFYFFFNYNTMNNQVSNTCLGKPLVLQTNQIVKFLVNGSYYWCIIKNQKTSNFLELHWSANWKHERSYFFFGVQWNLSKPNLLGAKFCVHNKQVFDLSRLY